MDLSLRSASSLIAVALIAMGCGNVSDRANPAAQTEAEPASAAGAVASRSPSGPDTTAQALWAYLQDQDYRANWRLWPGKDRLYAGTEPHGMLLTTYANNTAYEALQAGRVADLPSGSIIVKENWMADSTFAATTVMYRVDGYNPDHQDWLFAKFDPRGSPEAFGRAPMCQACHQNAETGYIYTAVQR